MKHLIGSITTVGFCMLLNVAHVSSSFAASTITNEVIYAANFGNGLVRGFTIGGSDLGNVTTNPIIQAEGIGVDKSNNFYVVSASGGSVRRFSPTWADLGLFITNGISDARSVVFDSIGNIYVDSVANNTVRKFSATGADLGNFITNGLSNPTGMAFDEFGNLFVSNYYLNQVKKFAPDGTYLGVAISAGLNQPVGVVVIPQAQGGGFYVANDFASTVIRYNNAGAIVATLTSGTLGRLGFMARDSAGNLYVTRLTGNAIRKFSPANVDLGDIAIAGLNLPSGIVIAQSVVSDSVESGLVAKYTFTGNASDTSGNGNNGSISNATLVPDRFGTPNSAFSFNGINARIGVSDSASLQSMKSNYTFNAWVNYATVPTLDSCILIKSAGAGFQNKWTFWRHVQAAPLGIGLLLNNGSSNSQWTSSVEIQTNRWYMLTFSASGTNCFIAVNGSVVSVQAGNLTLPNTTGVALFIGGAEPGGNQWFRGGLDDIRIYNRALSSNEVAQVYAAESVPSIPATSNEVVYVANYGNGFVRGFSLAGADLGNIIAAPVPQAQGIALDSSNNIYVGSSSGNYIRRFSPSGVDLGVFASTGISDSRGVVFDTNGNLYVANVGTATVRRFSPTGVDLGNFVSNGLSNPTGMAFDEAGNLYVANYNLNQVKKFAPNGAFLGVAISAGLSQPIGLVVIPQAQGGGFYVANDFASTVIRYNAAGAIVSTLTSGTLGRLHYLALDSAGNVYVTRIIGNAIRKFSPTGADLGDFAVAGLNLPAGIVVGHSAPAPLSPCENTVTLLQAQLAGANATNALLQAQLTAANNANATLQAQMALLQAANSNQQTQLITASNTIASLQSDLSTANDLISTLQARIASLEAANATLRAQLATANALNQQLQLQITSIAQSITLLEDAFAEEYGDPTFMIEGATLELQVSNLVMAIESLNHGHQLALKKALTNQKNAIRGF